MHRRLWESGFGDLGLNFVLYSEARSPRSEENSNPILPCAPLFGFRGPGVGATVKCIVI